MVRAPAGSGAGPDVPGSLRLDVVTIFPDYPKALNLSLIGRAARTGLIDLHVHDLREWTHDRHRTVDDTPLGGGAGMVMRPRAGRPPRPPRHRGLFGARPPGPRHPHTRGRPVHPAHR